MIEVQAEPTHWGANGSVHYPRRCLLCWVESLVIRLAVRLRLAQIED